MSEAMPGETGRWFLAEGINDLPARLRLEGAFLPRPLPSMLRLQPPTYRILAEAEQAIGRLDEAVARLPNRAALVRFTQLRDVRSSGELGGVYAALRELLVVDLPGVSTAPPVDLKLLRYLKANDEAVAWVRGGGQINLGLLSHLGSILDGERDTLGVIVGDEVSEVAWRTDHGWVGGPDPRDAYLLAAPPGAELQTGGMQWSAWVDSGCEAPLLARIALGHYQLAVLSPVAYSGHLSRLYITLALIRERALRDALLPVSEWLSRHRDGYRDRILAMVHEGDVDGFMVFFASGVSELCRDQLRFIRRAERLSEAHLDRLGRRMDGIVRVTRDLAATPVTTNLQIAQRCGITVQHAASLTKQLKRLGVIRSVSGKPYRQVFEVPDVMDLFELNDPLPPDEDERVFDAPA
jgi:cell filamentation protein, protein adenylyltransferase